jgi:hypothetical protein
MATRKTTAATKRATGRTARKGRGDGGREIHPCNACLNRAHLGGAAPECRATARFCRWWEDVRHPDLDGDGFHAGQLPAFGSWFDQVWALWQGLGRPEKGDRRDLEAAALSVVDGG